MPKSFSIFTLEIGTIKVLPLMKVSLTSVFVGSNIMSATLMFCFTSYENTCDKQTAERAAVPINSGWLYVTA